MIDFQFIDVDHLNLSFVEDWFKQICIQENKELSFISILIGKDEWLLEYNQKYLDHDFYTDIITFDYCEGSVVSGDLLISLERVVDNAQKFNVPRETELNRVFVHGLLHLLGFNDKSEADIQIMRAKENVYLELLNK